VVGLNGRAIGLLFNDAIWGKYPIGETLQMPGSRNANSSLVAQLIARGVIILVCNNSLRAAGQRFLAEAQRGDAARRTAFSDEARANLLPGVEVVPAMIVTLQQAQDRGCRYIYGGG
jgi:intracellular sulfur oxidation DsrE/DsrF family protein